MKPTAFRHWAGLFALACATSSASFAATADQEGSLEVGACAAVLDPSGFNQRVQDYFPTFLAIHGFLNQAFMKEERLWHPPGEFGVWPKLGRVFHHFANRTLRLLWPVSTHAFSLPTEPIFRRQWEEPGWHPDPQSAEIQLLETYRGLARFKARQRFLLEHPTLVRVKREVDRAKNVAKATIFLLALNHAYHAQAGQIGVQEYLRAPGNRLAHHQIRLLSETTPIPHLAIEIGDKVYSFGSEMATSSPTSLYLDSSVGQDRPAETSGGSSVQARRSAASAWGTIWREVPRSVQAVTLNLTDVERDNLKRDLESSAGRFYNNQTMVNDCATMVVRALRRNTRLYIPEVIDASPGQIILYFSALRSLGSSTVGRIYQIEDQEYSRSFGTVLRNLEINLLEGKLFVAYLEINMGARVYLDLTKTEEDLSPSSDELRGLIEEIKAAEGQKLKQDQQIQIFVAQVNALLATPRGSKYDSAKRELSQVVTETLGSQILAAQAVVESPETDFVARVRSQARVEYLKSWWRSLLELLAERRVTRPPLLSRD